MREKNFKEFNRVGIDLEAGGAAYELTAWDGMAALVLDRCSVGETWTFTIKDSAGNLKVTGVRPPGRGGAVDTAPTRHSRVEGRAYQGDDVIKFEDEETRRRRLKEEEKLRTAGYVRCLLPLRHQPGLFGLSYVPRAQAEMLRGDDRFRLEEL